MRIRFSSISSIILCSILVSIILLVVSCSKAKETGGTRPIVTTEHGDMVLAPAGWFTMGSRRGQDDEKPVRRVWMDRFLIDRYEVTQKNYKKLAKKDPSHFKGPNRPVEQVSWGEVAWYCNWRSHAEGLEACYDEMTGACNFEANGYRLPTEAEWEYACRAGSEAVFCFGDDVNKLSRYGWFADNSGGKTHLVGQKKPNAWGIYDMHGNVIEWCNDVYDSNYYAAGVEKNPRGPDEGPNPKFVLRGGAWNTSADACRSAYRLGEFPGAVDGCFGRDDLGFRCVRNAPAEAVEDKKADAHSLGGMIK